ncbi:cytochrome P450 [Dendrothele bispora CBS 962.96]|uniref:Cytochrome P450 n=1 Tax=Dendrothele bispora (strain CBS 962.96) TaxID=1314807 RepID=A0A4S8KW89_DENBC|nr:cytochrome P450 [Dendrothele bispora CBS 962.96]
MPDFIVFLYFLAAFGASCLISELTQSWITTSRLSKIPTAGPNSFFTSLFGSAHFVKHAREIIQEGYEKYHGKAFKVRTPDRWLVVASGPALLDDIKKASDDQLSFSEAVSDSFQVEYTMGRQQRLHRYHVDVVRNALTRNIQARFEEVRDEIVVSFNDEIPLTDEWTPILALDTIMRIVCRTSNRLFVGLPLCRDPDWINLNIQYTTSVFKAARIIKLFPDFLKPIVGNILTPTSTGMKRTLGHLGQTIKERLEKDDQSEDHGESKTKANDLVSWLLSENPGGEFRTVEDITKRVLNVNMAAIHTTSVEFTSTLYYLATQPPSVIDSLRQEIETVINEHGWTKVGMGQLREVDSFMKEVARISGISVISAERKVMKEFVLSDGTVLPVGTYLSVPAFALHHDERNYEDPNVFKPFRFSEMRLNEGESIKHQMVAPNTDYLFFGTGKHACPGRFFAVNELKTLVAHTLMNYDVKLEGDSKVTPQPVWFGPNIVPSRTQKVLFRKRQL